MRAAAAACCGGTDRGELVGRGGVLQQQVGDVGVALLGRLVQRSVAALQTHTGSHTSHRAEARPQPPPSTLVLPLILAWLWIRKFAIFALP